MITDLKTTVGYKCANCNRNNYKEINIFDVQPNKSVPLNCVCGAHIGEIRYKRNHMYVINSTCSFCAEQHSFQVKQKNFWNKNLLTYECPAAMLTYIALGENDAVHKQMHQADDEFEELLKNIQSDEDEATTEQQMFRVLEKIQSLDKEGLLYCTCGNHELLIDMQDEEIIVMCSDCGQRISIDTSDETEVETFLKMNSLVLKGIDH